MENQNLSKLQNSVTRLEELVVIGKDMAMLDESTNQEIQRFLRDFRDAWLKLGYKSQQMTNLLNLYEEEEYDRIIDKPWAFIAILTNRVAKFSMASRWAKEQPPRSDLN